MILIKMADISNEVRPMEVSDMWLECLLQEYFKQVLLQFYGINLDNYLDAVYSMFFSALSLLTLITCLMVVYRSTATL